MPALALYNYELDDACYKVRLALSILSVEYEAIAVDAFPGKEQTKPPLLDLNPLGRLPILRDGDVVLHGAEAILAHLARAYDGSGKWLPAEAAAFASVMQWLQFAASDLSVAREAREQALFDAPGDGTALSTEAARMLRIMDDHMTARSFAGASWFAAPHATIADIALFPAFALSRDFGVDHDEYPALRNWARYVRQLPGFTTMPGIPDYH
ncbi:glutathione S-transferase family protein [Chelativorans xinjiangense]|uniref:glutathione S-transferase family protein n=1 Tax=Chelativorans xinjiangense TaxID=2681485 RepID=UPI001358D2EA|nr:glutathione S-transferase family protein [Chelativorans xinjiangense]